MYSGLNAKIHDNTNLQFDSNSIKPGPSPEDEDPATKLHSVHAILNQESDPFTSDTYTAYEAALHVDGQNNIDTQ